VSSLKLDCFDPMYIVFHNLTQNHVRAQKDKLENAQDKDVKGVILMSY
jgi:hypothetical protein